MASEQPGSQGRTTSAAQSRFRTVNPVKSDSDAEKRVLARRVWQLQRRLFYHERPHFDRVMESFGLTATDYRALVTLKPGTMRSMGSLAERWRCDPSTVTWIIRHAERKGLVVREMVGSDRRLRMVALTPAGVKLRQQMLDALAETPDFLFDLPSEDLHTFLAILQKLDVPTDG